MYVLILLQTGDIMVDAECFHERPYSRLKTGYAIATWPISASPESTSPESEIPESASPWSASPEPAIPESASTEQLSQLRSELVELQREQAAHRKQLRI